VLIDLHLVKKSLFFSSNQLTIRFSLGSIAGAVGATAVYPIDLGIKFCFFE